MLSYDGALNLRRAGVMEDFGLADMCAHARSMRTFDGPDDVHRNQIARLELRKHS